MNNHDITNRWTYKDSSSKYMREKPIGQWSREMFLQFLEKEKAPAATYSRDAGIKLWKEELAHIQSIGKLLPTEVSDVVEILIATSPKLIPMEYARNEVEAALLWDFTLEKAESNKRKRGQYEGIFARTLNAYSISPSVSASSSSSSPFAVLPLARSSFLVAQQRKPFESQDRDLKTLLSRDSRPFEGFLILDIERMPSDFPTTSKIFLFKDFKSRSKLPTLLIPERTFIQSLVFTSAPGLGDYLNRTYHQMTRGSTRTAETKFLWNLTNSILVLWEKDLLLDDSSCTKNERWWLKHLHGRLTESLDDIRNFSYVESEIESASVKEYWGPNPPKFDGVGTSMTAQGPIDILIMEAKPYGGVGTSEEESDRRKVQEALICLFLALEAKLPKEHQRYILNVPMVAILLSAHKIKVFQGWMRPGGVLEFGVVGKAEVPRRGYDCQRLQPTLKTCIKARQAVIQSLAALNELLTRPSTKEPSSTPPSPVKKLKITSMKKLKGAQGSQGKSATHEN